ncbi:MAG: ZIP family metal transporter [Anaerolineales bacterium]|nr:ZIP family metal transporter [Anaerolineales bacterium]
MNLILVIFFTLLGSVCSVLLAASLLLFKGKRLAVFSAALIPYAIGTLLGAAFFGMIPHALEEAEADAILPAVLAGILLFYLIEKLALWRHCHNQPCEIHTQAGSLILIGDALHNFVDGVAIAAAFGTSVPLGIATSVAVIAHELPQEVGDFAILLESGYSRSRALLFNGLSSLAALLGAVLTYFLLPIVESWTPYLLALTAASFIYIALADLIPGRRSGGGLRSLLWELPLIGLGIATIVAFHLGNVH